MFSEIKSPEYIFDCHIEGDNLEEKINNYLKRLNVPNNHKNFYVFSIFSGISTAKTEKYIQSLLSVDKTPPVFNIIFDDKGKPLDKMEYSPYLMQARNKMVVINNGKLSDKKELDYDMKNFVFKRNYSFYIEFFIITDLICSYFDNYRKRKHSHKILKKDLEKLNRYILLRNLLKSKSMTSVKAVVEYIEYNFI
jgi:hypothetical protein